MKKILIAFLIFTSISVYSQEKKLSFGIDIIPSINWASTNTKSAINDGVSAGISYGAKLTALRGQNWGFLTGIRMSHLNFNIKYNSPFSFQTYDSLYSSISTGSSVNYKMQQIEVPLGFSFRSREIGYTTIAGEIGVLPAYCIKTKVNISSINVNGETAKDEISMFSAGYFLGGGILYSLGGSTAIKAMLSFSSGLTDLTKDKNSKEDHVYYYRLGLTLGIVF
ncbi:MAG TPA: outer membrane beta-barrel protein [Salinivirgaceae bacterium]|nr:outer membrane beta-barrel protein [Salinivirgaceae bacterium]